MRPWCGRSVAVTVTVTVTVTLAAAGCGAPLRQARLTHEEPEHPEERAAAARQAARACSGGWGLLFPGLGQLCTGRTAEGSTLAALAAAELATGVTVAARSPQGLDHPGAAVPLVAFQELWILGYADAVLDAERARRLRYVPPESLGELALAPFNLHALRHPDVWGGILGTLALGIGVSVLAGERLDTGRHGEDANVFGRRLRPVLGYPLAGAVGAALFGHVAMAEEATFRGWLQSSLARSISPTGGWVVASLIFGGVHAVNAFLLPPEERARYLLVALPAITVVGGWFGLSYRWHDYSLIPPTAIHFWYDFLLTAVFFAADPQNSPLSARLSFPF